MDEIIKYLIEIITWNIIYWLIVILFLLFFVKIPQAFYLTRKLLKKSRPVIGSWFMVKHYADKYIQIWYNLYWAPKSEDEKSFFSQVSLKEWFKNKLLNKYLLDNKLIYLDNHDSRYKAIKNIRNRIIVFLIKFWFIYIIGDHKNHYNHSKQQLKTQINWEKSRNIY